MMMRSRSRVLASSALAALLGALALGCSPASYCTDSCRHARDGECDDGRPGSASGLCARGTDCSDCGANPDVQLSNEITNPPSPVPGLSTDPPTSVPGPPGLPSCECPSRAYCAGTPTDPIYEGAGQFTLCGSGAPQCSHATVRCPTNGRGAWSPRIEYSCRDGEQGVGCYAIENESCEPSGSCGPPENYGIEGNLPGGLLLPIEHCVRLAVFLGPDDAGGEYLWRQSQCETYYRVGAHVASCGACASACDVFLSGGPNPCAAAYRDLLEPDPEPDPEPGVSPTCRAAIEQVRASLPTTGSSCTNSCVDSFLDCAARDNCASFTRCQSSYRSCLQRCY